MTDSIEARVARGAAWLDTVRPGWRDQISLDTLSLYQSDRCVMGQVFAGEEEQAGFYTGLSVINKTISSDWILSRPGSQLVEIADLGFNASGSGMEEAATVCAETDALVAEWRRVIHQSREQQPAEQREQVTA